MRKALMVGLDHYAHISGLSGCINDANSVKAALERHADGYRKYASCTPGPTLALTLKSKAGAQCGSPARWDLRGGPPAMAVPTATDIARRVRSSMGGDQAGPPRSHSSSCC